ncbi:hypothetical protein [Pandoravirus japonicus]|uniref:Transmembrane protein n=1 Tax=Pandoravirus japonicus TaxID=2823154 RepID=A0A811BSA8_9VIRU|nr:hypothetical protein [Pandoravirus japonicus]
MPSRRLSSPGRRRPAEVAPRLAPTFFFRSRVDRDRRSHGLFSFFLFFFFAKETRTFSDDGSPFFFCVCVCTFLVDLLSSLSLSLLIKKQRRLEHGDPKRDVHVTKKDTRGIRRGSPLLLGPRAAAVTQAARPLFFSLVLFFARSFFPAAAVYSVLGCRADHGPSHGDDCGLFPLFFLRCTSPTRRSVAERERERK